MASLAAGLTLQALAAGSQDLFEHLEIVDTLEDAIKDCHLVFGTS
jgi:tRNA (cytidine32/uridine32-2'-O)-methyltransferase